MDGTERVEHIVDKIEEKKSKFSRGAGRFENTLKPFGFGGEVNAAAGLELLEFSAVRNCLVHRQGVVDRRFMEACPPSPWILGSSIVITPNKCLRYSQAAQQYGATVASRIDDHYGAKFNLMKKVVEDFTSKLNSRIE